MQTVPLHPTDFDRLLAELKSHISKEVKSVVKKDGPIGRKQAAAYIKINVSTLSDWISSGVMPEKYVHKKGKLLFFYESELDQFIKER